MRQYREERKATQNNRNHRGEDLRQYGEEVQGPYITRKIRDQSGEGPGQYGWGAVKGRRRRRKEDEQTDKILEP